MNSKTHNKFIVPLLVTVAVFSLGVIFLMPSEDADETIVNQTSAESKEVEQEDSFQSQPKNIEQKSVENEKTAVNLIDADKRIKLIADRNDLSAYDKQQILAAINDPRVWDFSTIASADDLPLDTAEKEDGRTFFKANPARIAVSIPGDTLEISLPALGESILLEVEQASVPQDGLISLSGNIAGTTGTFSMTQGNNVVAGHINTSTNTYSFEIFGDTGWVTESGNLFTAELEPVVITEEEEQSGHSSLGHSGEHIIANGSITNEEENDIGSSSNNEDTSTEE